MSKQLLIIIQKLHSQEVVHRDIKPENIIIKNNELFLVDFGMSVNTNDKTKLTKTGQEVGNRFLRLPEFSAGAINKRDHRSDLTLAVGIMLYLITKVYPRNLVNADGQYAHQNLEAHNMISKLENSVMWNTFFDKAFQLNISKRWSFAHEIITIMNMIEKTKQGDISKFEESLRIHASTMNKESLIELQNNLTQLNNEIKNLVYIILRSKAKAFRTEEMGWIYNLGDIKNKNQIRAYPIGKNDKKEHVIINIITQLIGEQVVGFIQINEDKKIEVCRTQVNEFLTDYDKNVINDIINQNLLPELVKLI